MPWEVRAKGGRRRRFEGPEIRVAAGIFGRLRRAGALRALPNEEPAAAAEAGGGRGGGSGDPGGVAWLDLEAAERRFLLAACSDGTVSLLDTRGAAESGRALPAALPSGPEQSLRGAHSRPATSVQWYPVDSGLFVSAGADSKVKLWDANAFSVVLQVPHPSPVTGAFMSPGATQHCFVASGAEDGRVRVADPVHGAFVVTLDGHAGPVISLSWDPSCDWQLFSGDADGEVRVWDIRQPGSLATLDKEAFHADPLGDWVGNSAITGGGGGGTSGSVVNELPVNAGRFSGRERRPQGPQTRAHAGPALALLPHTSESLLTYGADSSVRLWDLTRQTYRLAGTVRAPVGPARYRSIRMCVSPDSSCLYVPAGPTVHVRELRARRKTLPSLQGHFDDARCCLSTGEAGGVLSGGEDGQVLLWEPAGDTLSDSEGEEGGRRGGPSTENCDAWSDDSEDRDLLRLDPELLLGAGLSAGGGL